MATIGTIQQFKGPFEPNQHLDIVGNCVIGISIAEDDFMQFGSKAEDLDKTGFTVNINGEDIQIGRTFIYESGDVINNTEIFFPKGAPLSTIVDVVYSAAN